MVDLFWVNVGVGIFIALLLAMVALRGTGALGWMIRQIRELIRGKPQPRRNENPPGRRLRPSERPTMPKGYGSKAPQGEIETSRFLRRGTRENDGPPRGRGSKLAIVFGVIGAIFAIVVFSQAVVIVEPGHRGVVTTLGAVEPVVLGEGFHTIQPFTQHVYQSDSRTQRYEATASAATKDLQEVSTTITVQYHIEPSKANVIYQTLGETYADKVVAPAIQESVKASTARFDAENLITQRALAKQAIEEELRKAISAREVGDAKGIILVEQVLITDFQFSPAFKAQIDAKAVAYQTYLTEQNKLLSAEVIANQTVVKAQADAQAAIAAAQGQVRVAELQAQARVEAAEGEAQAIQLLNDQLRDSPNYLQLQYIQHWNGQLPYYFGGGGNPNSVLFSIPPPATPN